MDSNDYLKILSANISRLRKQSKMTQEELAREMGITFQAVSKWESGRCAPDLCLLPELAAIFHVSIDQLFCPDGEPLVDAGLPWEDDDTLRIVVFKGRKLLQSGYDTRDFIVTYSGEALNVESTCSVNCGKVHGKVKAGGNVTCQVSGTSDGAAIHGSVSAGGDVRCGGIGGDAAAGCDIMCGSLHECTVNVGCNLTSGGIENSKISVAGNLTSGGIQTAGEIEVAGNLSCDEDIDCRKLTVSGNLTCKQISGDVHCEGKIIYQ